MSETSDLFVHPKDVLSQGSTYLNKSTSIVLTPDSGKDELNTSGSSSLFESEDMEQAFRVFYGKFSPERLYRSFEKEVNKIKSSQDRARMKQTTCLINTTAEGLFELTNDSGKGESQSSNSLFNSEEMENELQKCSTQLSPEKMQITFEENNQFEKTKNRNKDKSFKKQQNNDGGVLALTTNKENREPEANIKNALSHLSLHKKVNRTDNCDTFSGLPQSNSGRNKRRKNGEVNEIQNKYKKGKPRKIQNSKKNNVDKGIEKLQKYTYTPQNYKTQTLNASTDVLRANSSKNNGNNSFDTLGNDEEVSEINLLGSEIAKALKSFTTQCANERPTSSPMPRGLSKQEQMNWLRIKRNVGLWANCDRCRKWRYLKDTTDPLDLPKRWYCYMNPDFTRNDCSKPEEKIPLAQQKELITNKYHAGSIVFAKIKGLPWWPAMVQDNPEYLTYFILKKSSDVPIYYHVSFFCCKQTATGWIHVAKLKCFRRFCKDENVNKLKPKEKDLYELQIRDAKREAMKALKLTTIQRLYKYAI